MLKWADNCVEESAATTTGAYQLGGVPASGELPGAQTFVTGIGNGNTCHYYAHEVSGAAWERGIGTVTDATPDTLTRTAIHSSSNGGAAVDWTGKTVRIVATLPAYAVRRAVLDSPTLIENLTISASRSGNAETIAIKTLSGTDPSITDPVRIAFSKTDGSFEVLELTTALSLTLSSGSTLGAVSAEAFRLWLTVFNDAGTLRLGAIKPAMTDGIYGLQDNVLESSTAEGGAGAADSAGVIYTDTAVTSKAMRVLGYLEYTLTTAGMWDAAPSAMRLLAGLPVPNTGSDLGAIHVQDQKPSGTGGGASTAATWHTRTLNTVVSNSIPGASLASNQITLPAGTYDVIAIAPCHQGEGHRTAIYNVTASAYVLFGQSARSRSTSSTDGSSPSTTMGRFTLASTSTIELRHYISLAISSGLGNVSGSGQVEVYGDVFIRRVG